MRPPVDDPLEIQRIVAQTKLRLLGERQPVLLGRYEVEQWLGSGAFGTVYACRDPEMERRVAVKVLRADSSARYVDDALLREARAQARIDHPNVLGVLDVGRADGRAFIVMPLLEGDLAAWVRRDVPSPARLVEAIAQAGDGLAAAHAAGLVHCDVKATNLLRASSGQTVVADFGVATASGDRIRGGTPRTMAPEQRLGLAIDGRADQFSLALVLVEQWTDTDGGGVAPAMSAVLHRALQLDPRARFGSMRAFVGALRDAMQPGRRWVAPASAAATIGVVAMVLATPTPPPPPLAPTESSPAVQTSYRRDDLRRAAHAIQGSRLDEAEAILTEALARPDRPLDAVDRADALFLWARLAIYAGNDALAVERLESAYARAVVAGHPRVAVDAATMLAGAYTERGDREQGDRWLAQGRAEVRRAGDPPTLMLTWLKTAMGLQMSAGRIDEAVSTGQRAVVLATEPGVATVGGRITALRGLGLALRRAGRLPEAESRLRQALEVADVLGPINLQRASVLDVLAAVVAEQGRVEEGLALTLEALDIARALHGPTNRSTLMMRINLAGHQMLAEQFEAAVEELRAVVDVLATDDPSDPMLDRTRLELATALRKAGRLEEARTEAIRARVAMDTDGDHPPGDAERAREELAAIQRAIEATAEPR